MTDSPQRPRDSDPENWKEYWKSQGMSWRTEPEIDADRQAYLAERRAVRPDISKGIYPFRDENGGIKLTRADVEWLLATHESRDVAGPVVWDREKDKPEDDRRTGLVLCGSDLQGVDLRLLPLSRLVGGLALSIWLRATEDQRASAGIILRDAVLTGARLERAYLLGAHLERARLSGARLEGAYLTDAQLDDADLSDAHLEGAYLPRAQLHDATLTDARLDGANLSGARLDGAGLLGAHLDGADLSDAHLDGADLSEAFFDAASSLRGATFAGPHQVAVNVADVRWGDVNLAVVDWAQVKMLGDERAALDWKPSDDDLAAWKKLPRKDARAKEKAARRAAFEDAVRANRQLATALRDRGLNEHADRFAYRAQVLQRRVLRMQGLRRRPAYYGSLLLDWLAGYGYRPGRSFLAYLFIIAAFAAAYFVLRDSAGHQLRWYEAAVVSLTAFHGRGFFSQQFSPGDPQSIIAALEAVVGLVIEISFIATFTKRFFGQ